MSYIAPGQMTADATAGHVSTVFTAASVAAPEGSATTLVGASLEAALGLAIMAGLSLVLCTIAAGAIL